MEVDALTRRDATEEDEEKKRRREEATSTRLCLSLGKKVGAGTERSTTSISEEDEDDRNR